MREFAGLFTWGDLATEHLEGYVRIQEHPDDDELRIANYTEKAQYAKRWNAVTLNCRGLIFRTSGEIVARPFPKFFNYAEHSEKLDLDAEVEVVDKLDGSLGIMYMAPDGEYAIATRGSFTSEQALEGTAILREQYLSHWEGICSVCTYLFEIIYPENRIVVDYGPTRDLLLLGRVDKIDGWITGPALEHCDPPCAKADVFPARTLREALAMPPRENAEGVVVRYVDSGLQVKIKQDDYVALHKVVTGLNERAVYDHMTENDLSYDGLLEQAPDEFHDWIKKIGEGLVYQLQLDTWGAYRDHESIVGSLETGWTRKDYALKAQQSPYRAELFLLLDGKAINEALWKKLRPGADESWREGRKEAA